MTIALSKDEIEWLEELFNEANDVMYNEYVGAGYSEKEYEDNNARAKIIFEKFKALLT